MLDETTHALMLSLHKRLEALELQHSLGARAPAHVGPYSWPSAIAGENTREKWMFHNWEALKQQFEENRPRPSAANPDEKPIRVYLVDPLTGMRSSEYVGKEFHTFLVLAWGKAERGKTRNQERITQRRRIPDFTDADPDGTWGDHKKAPNTRCLSDSFYPHG